MEFASDTSTPPVGTNSRVFGTLEEFTLALGSDYSSPHTNSLSDRELALRQSPLDA